MANDNYYGQHDFVIIQKSELSVTFQLNSESAESFELFVHHCNVTVRIPRYHNTDILSVCPKSIYTYYGIFHHPCVETGKSMDAHVGEYLLKINE